MSAWPSNERFSQRAFFPLILVIFTASGFAGLIYESVWSHYLKLFLGHAAYAQTLVLAIFMGGMALGAWWCSRISGRWRDLLFAYAVIEALIGLAALGFHAVFNAATAFAFDHAIPAIGSPAGVQAFKWALGATLILPQSILLGMTFPLLTAGVVRVRPDRSGHAIAMLYFTNSFGAGIGVLASGFYFIPLAGLPGTLIASGIINLGVAAAVILLPGRKSGTVAAAAAEAAAAPVGRADERLRLLLAVAALTGASSFIYEIGWIRMLALVLGSSTHAFEIMLSAFILGLAFGGLWVRRRADTSRDTMRFLGGVQLAKGIAALATLPVYAGSFYLMQGLVESLAPTENGYAAYNFTSHGIALAVMFPAAFCAGMTLPLITKTLLRLGAGERAIGQVYAANTAGSIIGVMAAVHIGMTLLGVKGVIIAGAIIDLALAVALLGRASGVRRVAYTAGALAASAGMVLYAALGVQLDVHHMASGVYRHGTLLDRSKHRIAYHEDGKTTTVSVTVQEHKYALRNNGKSDGAVNINGEPTDDEVTMVLIGALPMLLVPDARHVANIGFGTGLTAHTILASEQLAALDTIEIEPAVVRAARELLPGNRRAYEDARSRVHLEDAKTFFSSRQAMYDVIVSEPSNPWVSGVASLFTEEFYRHARRHLREGGLFVQWVQLYEFSPVLLASVIQALRPVFSDYVIWAANDGDLIITAVNGGKVPEPSASGFSNHRMAELLGRIGVRNLEDLKLHRVASRRVMDAYFASFGAEANSDFFPLVDIHASKARFMRARATGPLQLLEAPLPLLDLFEPGYLSDTSRLSPGERPSGNPRASLAFEAALVRDFILDASRDLGTMSRNAAGALTMLRAAMVECRVLLPKGVASSSLRAFARLINGHLPGPQAAEVWEKLRASPCTARLDAQDLQWLELHAAIAAREPQRIAEAAEAILEASAELGADAKAYALAALMSGRILSGRPMLAAKAFRVHRNSLREVREWQPVFTFLGAHAFGPIGGTGDAI
ncbi:MAG TPA: fused MFS/spermidine synthase [Burkholderiales bacterium]|nr:fused MFS/spermidine synthase [Burkholderiales bacterium]